METSPQSSFLAPFVISDSFSLYSHFLSDLNQLYGLIWLYYFSPELQICITTSKSKTDFMINCPPPSTSFLCLELEVVFTVATWVISGTLLRVPGYHPYRQKVCVLSDFSLFFCCESFCVCFRVVGGTRLQNPEE